MAITGESNQTGSSKYLPFQQRVIDEYIVLNSNIIKLKDFISSNSKFLELGVEEQDNLIGQLKAMELYAHFLKRRISRF